MQKKRTPDGMRFFNQVGETSDRSSGAENLHAVIEARDFARDRVLVQNAFGDATHHFGLGGLQGCSCCSLIAGGKSLCHFTNEGADPREARLDHILA